MYIFIYVYKLTILYTNTVNNIQQDDDANLWIYKSTGVIVILCIIYAALYFRKTKRLNYIK